MAVLENIRKRTTVLILIIGMALFAFVISGIFTSNDFSGGKVGSTVAEINGEDISIDDFRRKIERISRRSGPTTSSLQLVNTVWSQVERQTILGQEFEDLGIAIEQDQIINVIKSSPGIAQNPQFVDENGVFDENRFKEFIADLRVNAPSQYEDWLQDEEMIIQSAKEQTYFNLVKAGVGATLKEGELDYKLANNKVSLRYVRVPYASIADSSVIISKKEIADYINAHPDEYKQERARDVQFVYFEEKPSAEDIAQAKEEITNLLEDSVEYLEEKDTTDTIPGFRNTADPAAFLDRNSDNKFDTIYKAKSSLPARFADTLFALKVGEVFGPYRDGDYFKVAKMINRKPEASVKASHILITYEGATRANPEIKRTKEDAEEEANRLLAEALKPGNVFAELARDNSDGPSAPKGGDLGYFEEGVMTPKFNDFVFGNATGHIGLVETEFGYHIVRVDDKRDLVQIAILTREIEPSEETLNGLFTNATKFEMETTSADRTFDELAKESEYAVRPVNKIKEMDEYLPGLNSQRNVVQWAFNEETEIGDIKRFNINNGYAVIQLTAKYEEGLKAVEDASAQVLQILRKEKKAERIIAENTGKSLEQVASDNATSVSSATSLTVKAPTIPGAGKESLVVGTAFSMNQGETSGLIQGETGVFMFEVVGKEDAPSLENYVPYANDLKAASAAKVNATVYNALLENADIEDNRATFY
ncbi:MAG: SurA N-terminal domain-containing protein [Flavobacteriaceae bacterium]